MDNQTDYIFFNNFLKKKKDKGRYNRVFELAKGCKTLIDIRKVLSGNQFSLIDIERGRTSVYKYADNNNTIVKVYEYNGYEKTLTVSVSYHSFDSVKELQGFHKSWDTMVNMTPLEMQE